MIYIASRYDIHGKKILESNEKVYWDDLGPLEKIRDNHPKYVISATLFLTSRDENGIEHISLREFLNKGLKV